MKDLDSISKPLSDVVSKVTAPDAVKNALSGTWLGHQLHPMLTDLPIGAWSMASALDLTSRGTMPKASERLVGLGILTAVPAALSGASDWSESYGKEQRLGLVHALGNSVGKPCRSPLGSPVDAVIIVPGPGSRSQAWPRPWVPATLAATCHLVWALGSITPHFKRPSPSGSTSPPKTKRSEEHTSELQSRGHLVCRLLLE